MNLFKRLFSTKEEIAKNNREKNLRVQYKTYISKKEQEIAEKEIAINDAILNDTKNFSNIVQLFEDLELLKDDLVVANDTYEYIFTEKEQAKK